MKYRTNKDLKKHFKIKVDNKMRCYGDTDLNKNKIRINKKKSKATGKETKRPEVLDTIVHEAMHAKHPKMHEYTVRRKTKAVLTRLNHRQKASYYSLAA